MKIVELSKLFVRSEMLNHQASIQKDFPIWSVDLTVGEKDLW